MRSVALSLVTLALVPTILLAGCGGAEDAVAKIDGVQDVKSCEDTGEAVLNAGTGDEEPIYRCVVKQDAAGGGVTGLSKSMVYRELCYVVPDGGGAYAVGCP